MSGARGPAYRVETPRLLIKCWDPAEAPVLTEAIGASLDHLRPWMPWVIHEPETLAAKSERLRRMRAAFDRDEDYIYGVLDPTGARVLGGAGLHPRVGLGAREIGYWIRPEEIGKGLAGEAAAALTRVAFEVDGVRRVEIRMDPANTRSAAVPRKLGFTHQATLRRYDSAPDGADRDTMVWTMFADEFAKSRAAEIARDARAFDALRQRLF